MNDIEVLLLLFACTIGGYVVGRYRGDHKWRAHVEWVNAKWTVQWAAVVAERDSLLICNHGLRNQQRDAA